MSDIKSYRDQIGWQKSMLLVKQTYRMTQGFPREEAYGLTSQMRRAAVSIPGNIAEGHGRYQTKDFIRFLRMSTGSQFELQTPIEIAHDLLNCSDQDRDAVDALSLELERMLSSLIRKLNARITD